jgi:hypothetical protein
MCNNNCWNGAATSRSIAGLQVRLSKKGFKFGLGNCSEFEISRKQLRVENETTVCLVFFWFVGFHRGSKETRVRRIGTSVPIQCTNSSPSFSPYFCTVAVNE